MNNISPISNILGVGNITPLSCAYCNTKGTLFSTGDWIQKRVNIGTLGSSRIGIRDFCSVECYNKYVKERGE